MDKVYDFKFKGTRSAAIVKMATGDLVGYHLETFASADEFLRSLPHASISSDLIGLAMAITWPTSVYVLDGPTP
jgi:hypothetical protein